jgi:hypothetical protein
MFDVVHDMGLEGLVCKRASSTYQPGSRSQAWIKSVVRLRAPMVVGGWVAGRTGHVGSLLVGAHDASGRLVYCGHVGFGFTAQIRRELTARFSEIPCPSSPFDDLHQRDGVKLDSARGRRQRRLPRIQRPTAAPLPEGTCRHGSTRSAAAREPNATGLLRNCGVLGAIQSLARFGYRTLG